LLAWLVHGLERLERVVVEIGQALPSMPELSLEHLMQVARPPRTHVRRWARPRGPTGAWTSWSTRAVWSAAACRGSVHIHRWVVMVIGRTLMVMCLVVIRSVAARSIVRRRPVAARPIGRPMIGAWRAAAVLRVRECRAWMVMTRVRVVLPRPLGVRRALIEVLWRPVVVRGWPVVVRWRMLVRVHHFATGRILMRTVVMRIVRRMGVGGVVRRMRPAGRSRHHASRCPPLVSAAAAAIRSLRMHLAGVSVWCMGARRGGGLLLGRVPPVLRLPVRRSRRVRILRRRRRRRILVRGHRGRSAHQVQHGL
jgi:hypothetical protein